MSNTPFLNLLAESRATGIPLIAVHRGTSSGLINYNTADAAKMALKSGGDIAELDVVRSADGIYYTFHDGYEWQLKDCGTTLGNLESEEIDRLSYYGYGNEKWGGIERFEHTIKQLPQVFVNVDRSYRYWEGDFLLKLAEWAEPEYMLVKSNCDEASLQALAEKGSQFPFIPIVKTMEDVHRIWNRPGINLVGMELIADDTNSLFFDSEFIKESKARGLAIWFNAINLENQKALAATFDDQTSLLEDPDEGWGQLVERGADIIQTDWPWLLRPYLTGKRGRI